MRTYKSIVVVGGLRMQGKLQYSGAQMAKARRTRKQKLGAKQRRSSNLEFRLTKEGLEKISKSKLQKSQSKSEKSLFSYDPGLIRSDLTKTMVVSILAVATIVAVSFL